MNRDPSVVSFTKVGAEVVAGVVGGFVDALSWRSLVSPCLSLLFLEGRECKRKTADVRLYGLMDVLTFVGTIDGAVRIVPVDDHLDQFYPLERTEETPTTSGIWLSPSRSTGWTSGVRSDRTRTTVTSGLCTSASAVSLAAACHGTWTGAGERERWRGWVRVVGVGVDEIVSGSSVR
jgi:hypothetical protein